MDFTLIQSLWSIVILITFIGIVLWAFGGKRKARFDEDAKIPFEDEEPGISDNPSAPKKTQRSR